MPWAIFLCPQQLHDVGTSRETWAPKHSRDMERSAQIKFAQGEECVAWFESGPFAAVEADPECLLLGDEASIDDRIPGPEVSRIRNFLEAAGIPGIHVNASLTRRDLIRQICAMFQFSQRMEGRFGQGWKKRCGGLETTWNRVPKAVKDEISAVRDSFAAEQGDHWKDIGAKGKASLRNILRKAGERFCERHPIKLGTLEI